jgi:hypothetical protein
LLKSLKDDLSNTLPKEAIEGLEKNDTTAAAISEMEMVKAVGIIWFVYVFTDHKYTDRCLDGQILGRHIQTKFLQITCFV